MQPMAPRGRELQARPRIRPSLRSLSDWTRLSDSSVERPQKGDLQSTLHACNDNTRPQLQNVEQWLSQNRFIRSPDFSPSPLDKISTPRSSLSQAHESGLPNASLYQAAVSNQITVYATFGGQGSHANLLPELRTIYNENSSVVGELVRSASATLQRLGVDERFADQYPCGFDLCSWLEGEAVEPEESILRAAPISMPLIGLLQMCHYRLLGHDLGCTPADMHAIFSGATGHSQGIVTAAVAASSRTWPDFERASLEAVMLLQAMGARSSQVFPDMTPPLSVTTDAVHSGQGEPTPMLSIRNVPLDDLRKAVSDVNRHLAEVQVEIALINGPQRIVVNGPPASLHDLATRLQKRATRPNPNRLNATQKGAPRARFLPISAPFHSTYLEEALELVIEDVYNVTLQASDLAIPLFSTANGQDLRRLGRKNIIPYLAELVLVQPLDWEAATLFESATTIVDFGPGASDGAGGLTLALKEGTGARIILANVEDGDKPSFGYRPSLLGSEQPLSAFSCSSWLDAHGPKMVRTASSRSLVNTRFSRLLGLPPLMVPGMTPTTCSVDFVIAIMKAGYHVELAAGGFRNSAMMTAAVKKIANNVPGRGIAINVIYADPLSLNWQIPLVAKLRGEGYPIDSLTIGAGVPSLDVATEYIETLGLRYISFKPGSTAAIKQVVAIAQAHPDFPIVMQWTGGRGGGHHSAEDFHHPLLEMYARIRECSNICLVVGSGLGNGQDSYPYLSGQWSRDMGYAAMPCDGILMGSRMMVAKEAETSLAAKQAIIDAPGTADPDWDRTYERPSGGVLTVKSEMGEPIHKLATRLVCFWHEMDHTVFKLPKDEMLEQLRVRRSYIIQKLNADCHKVWFGKTASSESADIEEMTYKEMVTRLVDLTYLRDQGRWIDPSYRVLVNDVMMLAQSRFATTASEPRISVSADPQTSITKLFSQYPKMANRLVIYKDSRQFLEMCRRRGQKPVPFVPVLDANFETWFKKDSLWQSEDLDAVIDRDVGRVCILHGPVAARYSTTLNQSAGEILDEIHGHYIKTLTDSAYHGRENEIPAVECFGIVAGKYPLAIEPSRTQDLDSGRLDTYDFSNAAMEPAADALLSALGGTRGDWRHALFTAVNIAQGSKLCFNPMRRLFEPSSLTSVEVHQSGKSEVSISLFEKTANGTQKVVEVSSNGDGIITVQVLEHHSGDKLAPARLHLSYAYQPEYPLAPVREVTEGRNQRIKDFYRQIWLSEDEAHLGNQSITEPFLSNSVTVNSEDIIGFAKSIGNYGNIFAERGNRNIAAPMDYAIVLGWKVLVMPLLTKDLDCDLLRLVHLSNSFELVEGATPIRGGDVISAASRVTAVTNSPTGKRIRIQGEVIRDSRAVIKIASEFFVRGTDADYDTPFETINNAPVDVTLDTPQAVAVLLSKPWLRLNGSSPDVLGCKLRFALNTTSLYDSQNALSGLSVSGNVFVVAAHTKPIAIGRVEFEDSSARTNPVSAYLARHGKDAEKALPLPNANPFSGLEGIRITVPPSNKPYSQVSGDTNPIHTNGVLARYAELPGTITHGMHTSAIVRGLVEQRMCEGDDSLFREFTATFTGMVLPGDTLEVAFEHTAMRNGLKVMNITATKASTQQVVLQAEALIEAPKTAYVFTGQGSQRQGMGMDLYAESEAARAVWDFADSYFLKTYGFSIINIVKNNPKELTVRFGGVRGRAIRENYMRLKLQTVDLEGNIISKPLFPSVHPETDSYRFVHPEGLLSATQFTQPALTIMEKAIFEDLRARGLISERSSFAGHSLGEYAALCSMGGSALTLESVVETIFYRGMSMQAVVPRDAKGNSDYAMCAVDPSRVGAGFDDKMLTSVVKIVSEACDALLEIVNFNVHNMQYVCTGDVRAIACMSFVLEAIGSTRVNLATKLATEGEAAVHAHLKSLVAEWNPSQRMSERPVLKRGKATIPLQGIDVPFHSSFLLPGVDSFRTVLSGMIKSSNLEPQRLSGKYIPNLTAQPFEISKDYFAATFERTGSKALKTVLDKWDDIVSGNNCQTLPTIFAKA